jgi:hypothetical protein
MSNVPHPESDKSKGHIVGHIPTIEFDFGSFGIERFLTVNINGPVGQKIIGLGDDTPARLPP